jgi:hypothetical protein
MALDAEERALAQKMDKERLFDLLNELKAATKAVISNLKLTPGGDAYTYEGSTNDIDWLRESAEAWEHYQHEVEN